MAQTHNYERPTQLGKLTEQFEHIKESTLGQIGAITQPFTDLASVPSKLIGTRYVLEIRLYRRSRGTRHGGRAVE